MEKASSSWGVQQERIDGGTSGRTNKRTIKQANFIFEVNKLGTESRLTLGPSKHSFFIQWKYITCYAFQIPVATDDDEEEVEEVEEEGEEKEEDGDKKNNRKKVELTHWLAHALPLSHSLVY